MAIAVGAAGPDGQGALRAAQSLCRTAGMEDQTAGTDAVGPVASDAANGAQARIGMPAGSRHGSGRSEVRSNACGTLRFRAEHAANFEYGERRVGHGGKIYYQVRADPASRLFGGRRRAGAKLAG
jgi:hypothetical protein